jgi:hypothetical protein
MISPFELHSCIRDAAKYHPLTCKLRHWAEPFTVFNLHDARYAAQDGMGDYVLCALGG